MSRLICVFLDCDLPIQLLLKSLSNEYHDRLEDLFIMYLFTSRTTKYVTFYARVSDPTYAKYFMLHKVFYCAKVSNKQSAKVICRLDRLRTTAHSTARVKKPYEQWKTYRLPMH